MDNTNQIVSEETTLNNSLEEMSIEDKAMLAEKLAEENRVLKEANKALELSEEANKRKASNQEQRAKIAEKKLKSPEQSNSSLINEVVSIPQDATLTPSTLNLSPELKEEIRLMNQGLSDEAIALAKQYRVAFPEMSLTETIQDEGYKAKLKAKQEQKTTETSILDSIDTAPNYVSKNVYKSKIDLEKGLEQIDLNNSNEVNAFQEMFKESMKNSRKL